MHDEPTTLLTFDDAGLWAVRSASETIYIVDLGGRLLLRAPGPSSVQGEGGGWVRLVSMEHVVVGQRPRWRMVGGSWWRQSAVTSISRITRDDVDCLVAEAAAGKNRTEPQPESSEVLEARRDGLLAWMQAEGLSRRQMAQLAEAGVERSMLAHGELMRTEGLLADLDRADTDDPAERPTASARPRAWVSGAELHATWETPGATDAGVGEPAVAHSGSATDQHERCGIVWGETQINLDGIHTSSVDQVLTRFGAQLPEIVWNAAVLEGNTHTLSQVRTLASGVTVGGVRVAEFRQIVALIRAHERLGEMVAAGTFRLDKATSDELHKIVARHEAPDPGRFRGQGRTAGGGDVRLSDGSTVEGTPTGPGGATLRQRFEDLLAYIHELPDPRMQALVYAAAATRAQFYFDGNKRSARLMATGLLMSNGFDAVSVPATRRLEFNHALDTLFTTDDATVLMSFLASCTID